jgi:hypothetical protein
MLAVASKRRMATAQLFLTRVLLSEGRRRHLAWSMMHLPQHRLPRVLTACTSSVRGLTQWWYLLIESK